MDEKKRFAFRRGLLVFLALAVLTGIEYVIGVLGVSGALVVVMVAIALLKAGLVVWFYMHIKHIFSPAEEGEE